MPYLSAGRSPDWSLGPPLDLGPGPPGPITFTKIRFGIPRSFIRDLRATFPLNEAYKAVAMPGIARYAVTHLTRPLPMMRW